MYIYCFFIRVARLSQAQMVSIMTDLPCFVGRLVWSHKAESLWRIKQFSSGLRQSCPLGAPGSIAFTPSSVSRVWSFSSFVQCTWPKPRLHASLCAWGTDSLPPLSTSLWFPWQQCHSWESAAPQVLPSTIRCGGTGQCGFYTPCSCADKILSWPVPLSSLM